MKVRSISVPILVYIHRMNVFKQMDAWTTPKLVGFTGIDLGNYEVAKALTPVIKRVMSGVERWDVLCSQVTLKGSALEAVAEGEDPRHSHEVVLPPGMLSSMRDWSKGPCPPWPVDKPPADVAARLNKLDEALFGEGAVPGRVFMNAQTYADVQLWRGLKAEPPFDRIDIESRAVFLKLGFVANLVTHGPEADARQLWLTRLVPPGFIFIDPLETMTPFPRAETPSDDELISLETT